MTTTTPDSSLFPLWLRYAREEYARPPIVEALDAAMQLVATSYEEDLGDDIEQSPQMQRFVAMRQAILDRAVAEDRVAGLVADLELAEKALRHVRLLLPTSEKRATGVSARSSEVMSTVQSVDVETLMASGRSRPEAELTVKWIAECATESATIPVPPCPTWCTKADGHPWDEMPASLGDAGQNVYSREHVGPVFGSDSVRGYRCCGWEYSDGPGIVPREVLLPEDDAIEDPAEMRAIAKHAAAAAVWLDEIDTPDAEATPRVEP